MKTDSIKVSELFYSMQGEGRYMGVPSVFLRTFGCNFQCNSFGMPKGEKSTERLDVAKNIKSFKIYNDLPLVASGCDSYASWDPKFKHLSPVLTIDTIAETIVDLLPFKEWRDEHLVITGGEPLLGWQKTYPALLDHPNMQRLSQLTFETNGTQALTKDLTDYLHKWSDNIYGSVTFSVSPKLSVSGESHDDAICPQIVRDYQRVGVTYLKFVVASEDDVAEALIVTEEYRDWGFNGAVYLMPVGGVESVYSLNNRRVADLAIKHGVRYSDRLHVPLWKNAWGT